jgi:hypothetical protein
MDMEKIALLALELTVVFVAVPLLLYYRVVPNAPIPFLLALALVAVDFGKVSKRCPISGKFIEKS